jgi:hypothetical protein
MDSGHEDGKVSYKLQGNLRVEMKLDFFFSFFGKSRNIAVRSQRLILEMFVKIQIGDNLECKLELAVRSYP